MITKSVRHTFLNLSPLVLSKRARTIPKKKVVAVAATAQIKVHVKSGKKVPAIRPCKTSPKLEKPTQSKSDFRCWVIVVKVSKGQTDHVDQRQDCEEQNSNQWYSHKTHVETTISQGL